MQLGFNTNFRYRDVVFHVQTEDSGRSNPHVITHLFHGGNILASVKSDYSDLLSEADLEGAVRRLMESQHKAMLKQLSRGEFDRVIGERLGAEVLGEAQGPAAAAAPRPDSESAATDGAPARPRRAGTTGSTPASTPETTPAVAAPAPTNARGRSERTPGGAERRESTSGLARVFGERVVSEKPLDEVVLDYLVENARKRKRQTRT